MHYLLYYIFNINLSCHMFVAQWVIRNALIVMSYVWILQNVCVHNEISRGILQKFLVSGVGQTRYGRLLTSIPSRRRIIIRHLFSRGTLIISFQKNKNHIGREV